MNGTKSYHGCLRHMWDSDDAVCPMCLADAESQATQQVTLADSLKQALEVKYAE